MFYFPVDGLGALRRQLFYSLAEYIEVEEYNTKRLESTLRDWPKVGTVGASDEQEEFLRTNRVEGYDLEPLSTAILWCSTRLQGGLVHE